MEIKIPLTRGDVAKVDEIDADLASYNWCVNRGGRGRNRRAYAVRNSSRSAGKRHIIHMHRIILERKLGRDLLVGEEVDHINHNSLDNRRINLRLVNRGQNQANRRVQSTKAKTSHFNGVSWDKDREKWRAYIRFNGKTIHIGLFNNEEDAAAARDRYSKRCWGNYARLNLPQRIKFRQLTL